MEIDPDLPLILVDGVLLEIVLVNILDNAAKYAPEGTEITISERFHAGLIEIAVADRGPAIPAADRARVFDMFDRVAGGDRQRAGTGLGLAICNGLVEAMGGTIKAEAGWSDGTRSRIVLVLPTHEPETVA